MTNGHGASSSTGSTRALVAALWKGQCLIFAFFGFAGVTKLTKPIAQLAGMMPWTGELPASFVRLVGLIDLGGGIGVLLPSLTRIKPLVALLAALGCTVLQLVAAVFYAYRESCRSFR